MLAAFCDRIGIVCTAYHAMLEPHSWLAVFRQIGGLDYGSNALSCRLPAVLVQLVERLAHELSTVAHAHGVPLSAEEIAADVARVAAATANNTSSMLADVASGSAHSEVPRCMITSLENQVS